MPNAKPTRIAIGRHENLFVIKLTGHCTMMMGTCLRKLLDQCRQPQITDVYFDLSEVEYIDSTCVGLVISLASKKNDPSVPQIHLLRPASGVVRALETMHVLGYLDRCDTLPTAITPWKELPVEVADREEIAVVIIDAHENLIKADARNTEMFRPVVDGLRAYQRNDKTNLNP